ncbi:MAG: polysaccharide export protein [Pyrinomonadaceae bacterium]|nr:polysaccharide export protein [Pyrinomonadaceae bacterium]
MKHFKIIIGFCFLAMTFTVAQAQSTSPIQSLEKEAESNKPKLKTPAENRYRLVSGDVLDVIYRYTPEFNQTTTIQPDGYILLEIVGEIKISGLTLEEARQKLIEKANVRLKDPEITLLLKEFQKPYFVVSGEVMQTGKFEMREDITALQAVMMAGGFKESAKVSQVVVFRKLNAEFAEVKTLNLKKVKQTSDLENDLNLQSGDIIFVPRNTFSKIEKYVRLSSLGAILNPIIR